MPEAKPEHRFTQDWAQAELDEKRVQYDEYIAYVDAELGRLLTSLDAQGTLDDTLVIVTSDHGELFERGIWRHWTEVLYEPVIHIPLVISRPGQSERRDVYEPTSSVDVLPTLCEVAGRPIPDWCEGHLLPGFGAETGQVEPERVIYSVDSKSAERHGPLNQGTIALRQGKHKLIHYFGYEGLEDIYELYDLENDPQEKADLFRINNDTATEMQQQLLWQLKKIDG